MSSYKNTWFLVNYCDSFMRDLLKSRAFTEYQGYIHPHVLLARGDASASTDADRKSCTGT